ncbi:MAG: uroporphyrinogen-III C-methyltransferase [Candidatus Binatia bacterium]|nr:uroporphyrinogen-III C-methyltransferase [Candidatus Binatia bacterium]
MGVGFVYLVGAGPGDPGCLTLRGRECLRRADVVVYDYLANAQLLAHAPAAAERVFAGKHGAGPHLLEQSDINALLLEHAAAGRTVVRLKGGDPFVFGRGGEEAEALAAAGVTFEIVPGVTSALAGPAYAGIPVTHRDWVSGVTVLTGHEANGKMSSRVDWKNVATAGNTIVLLMGLTQLRANLARLLDAGLSPNTPAAALRWASRPQQVVVEGTVGSLAELAAAEGIRPPATIVIGEVVRLRDRMAWFERRPLFGRRVLVTRTRAQAGRFRELLAEQGAEVLECPVIEIRTNTAATSELERAFSALDEYDWLLFTSANGVDVFFEQLFASGRDLRALHRLRLGVIGSETGRSLQRLHLEPDLVPDDFKAEGLLAALEGHDLQGKRVLLPRAVGARTILPETLRARGAVVDEIGTYESVPPTGGAARLKNVLAGSPPDCLTFTSSSTVTSFLMLVDAHDGPGRLAISGARIACIGPITAQTARDAGLQVEIVSDPYTVPALTNAILTAFAKEEG